MRISQLKTATSLALLALACGAPMDGDGVADDDVGDGAAGDDALINSTVDGDTIEPETGSGEPEPSYGQLEQALGGSCGTQNTTFDRFVTATVVPDHFPPDSVATQLAATALGIPLGGLGCVAFGVANMGSGCDSHDSCYGTLGASRSSCDSAARRDWRRACTRTYDDIDAGDVALGFLTGGISTAAAAAEQACRTTCLGMAETMFQAVSRGGQDAFDAAQAEAARVAREQAIFSGARPVRLHTMFTGDDSCFDVINDALDNRVTMRTCANVTGQIWTITPGSVAGTFRLTNQFTGPDRCLDLIGGQVSLAPCGNFSGQLWRFKQSRFDDFVHLETLFTGSGTCLDLIGGVPTMTECGDFSGQFWRFE